MVSAVRKQSAVGMAGVGTKPAIDIGIGAKERQQITDGLARVLADTYTLYLSIEETSGVPEAMEMVRLLVAGHEALARTVRSVFPIADEAHDESTADLLTQRLQIHEKTAWMLRSLLS